MTKKIIKVKKVYLSGWGTGKDENKPFSEEEFNRSYIKKNTNINSYDEYLRSLGKLRKVIRVRKSEEKVKRVRKVRKNDTPTVRRDLQMRVRL